MRQNLMSCPPMLKRFGLALFLPAMLISTAAYAQNQPKPAADQEAIQQQMQQQMHDFFGTVMQNMQAKGIDPRQFFQQMQSGADPADIQQQMIDQGIIDQKTVDQMQATMAKLTSNSIKDRLGATDTEWTALEPLIQNVQAATAAVGKAGGRMGMSGFIVSHTPAADALSKAKHAMAAALKDPATTSDQFAAALKAVRDAKETAHQDLETARQNLISVLTLRQEGILVSMGIID